MKLYVDTSNMKFMVTKDPEPRTDDKGAQRTERNTNRLMWQTQVFVKSDEGGEVLMVNTVGDRPVVTDGDSVIVEKLEAIPWSTKERSGVSWRAVSITSKSKVASLPKSQAS